MESTLRVNASQRLGSSCRPGSKPPSFGAIPEILNLNGSGRLRAEGEGGGGAARAGDDGELIGDLPDDPKAVAVLSWPRLLLSARVLALTACGSIVADQAGKSASVSLQPQATVAGAVPDGVGGQLVHGEHHVVQPRHRQPRLGGVRGDG